MYVQLSTPKKMALVWRNALLQYFSTVRSIWKCGVLGIIFLLSSDFFYTPDLSLL